ncbi:MULTISPECIES: hypothetical protein [Sphingobacterium]|jgi:hypothetical protein|uniref:hypothetical protein n=1 Tax=Sphingobacterium TaxID=28453 RepID=UPI002580B78C|nr:MULTISPECIES: hypothetical protein [Sphingobacterium]
MKDYYRLSKSKKEEIAQNLIDIIDKGIPPTYDTRIFIGNWILTDRSEKFKAYYDVWEIVLKNFLPKTKPILIRSISRKSKAEYIASFTNSVYSAVKFGQDKGYWIICDTKECLPSSKSNKGKYRYTFYPLSQVLKKAKENGGWGFSDRLLRDYAGEDEYIMKIDFSVMQLVKFIEHNY